MNTFLLRASMAAVCFFVYANSCFAQGPVNMNPDPNGQPWIAGGVLPFTPEAEAEFNKMPLLDLSKRRIRPPGSVDNTVWKFFPPIFNQVGNCCAQASAIGIQFTYEINCLRNTEAKPDGNRFPSHFTWNFVNDGKDQGSWSFQGIAIVKDHGCITVADWGGIGDDSTYWATGYEKYYRGMHYRITRSYRINIKTIEGLATLKQWLFDHGNGSPAGGLANFSVYFGGITMPTIDGKPVVTSWGAGTGHAMTFVGYDDNIGYDVNGDGQITNTVDITRDGVVDLRDYEKGVLKIANTWGPTWQDNGCIYMQYRLCALGEDEGGIGENNSVTVMEVAIAPPRLTLKAVISTNIRSYIGMCSGLTNNIKDTVPLPGAVISYHGFSFAGGNFPMQGFNRPGQLEFGLDLTPVLDSAPGSLLKAFLMIDCKKETGDAKIVSLSAIDYRSGTPLEMVYTKTNMPIKYGRTYIPIILDPAYKPLQITTGSMPNATVNTQYSATLEASGGYKPYAWRIKPGPYTTGTASGNFPTITTNELAPDNIYNGIAQQALAFEFPFYGQKYNQIYVTTGGAIVFEPKFVSILGEKELSANRTIAVLGADYFFNTFEDYIYYAGDQTKATFRWQTKHMVNISTEVNFDFAVTLYPSGDIEFYYGKALTDNITGMVIGISDKDDGYYVSPIKTTSDIPDNYSFKLCPAKSPAGMTISKEGIFSGKPTEAEKTWDINFVVTDKYTFTETKTIQFSTKKTPIIMPLDNPMHGQKISFRPLSGGVSILYHLDKRCRVIIELYSITGKKVAQLAHRDENSGEHSVLWDYQAANAVSTGMYYCRVQIDNTVHIKPVTIVK